MKYTAGSSFYCSIISKKTITSLIYICSYYVAGRLSVIEGADEKKTVSILKKKMEHDAQSSGSVYGYQGPGRLA